MTVHSMFLENVDWDDTANTAVLTFRERDTPPPPPGGAGWWPGPGESVTMTVPVKKNATVTNPTGIQLTTDANGVVVYTKFEYVNGAWVNEGRVNADGSPYTG